MENLDGDPGVILVEPLVRGLNGAYPLETAADALTLIDKVRPPHAKLLLDTFLARNDENLTAVIEGAASHIGHVQLADSPDRGEPGSGTVDFAATGACLRSAGYSGSVAAEYKPAGETRGTLGWLDGPTAPSTLA